MLTLTDIYLFHAHPVQSLGIYISTSSKAGRHARAPSRPPVAEVRIAWLELFRSVKYKLKRNICLHGSFGVCLSCHCLVCSFCPHRRVVPEDGNGFKDPHRRILHLISVAFSIFLKEPSIIERKKRQKSCQEAGY